MTLGHLDIAARAAKMFDEVHVLVVHNPGKEPRFSLEQRVAMIESAVAGVKLPAGAKILVATLPSGLLVDYCLRVGASALVKGVRTNVDLDYELPMAQVNRDLADVESIFIPADPSYGHISSTLVKQVADLGGDVTKYVPAAVVSALKN